MNSAAAVSWRETPDGELAPFVREGKREYRAVWAAQPGSQQAFLECPVTEALITGTRGGGKSDLLLMDFAQHVGRGYGAEWRGILFRRTFPELSDLIAKSQKWFRRIFPQARYNQQQHVWRWPGGETLRFAYMAKESDYYAYHGMNVTWIGWDELTTWPDLKPYQMMFSCLRSSVPGIPLKVRATTNPYGPGHNAVKHRFRLPVAPGRVAGPVIQEQGKPQRVAIQSSLYENKILLHADPNYIERIREAARNPNELKAWLEGSWDIVAGGMFDDLWAPKHHVLPAFPFHLIPKGWRIDRSYDHGQSKPFSVGWWAESNGEPIEWEGQKIGTVRGDLIRIAEWYGWNGTPNEGLRMLATEIAKGILKREAQWGLRGRVRLGPADASIFDEFEPGKSVAGDMKNLGVRWEAADKRPGSRKQGWEQLRKLLQNAKPKDGIREEPGLFVTERCEQFIRTVPVLPRSERDPDDADTDAEDHIGDDVRYRCRRRSREFRVRRQAPEVARYR